MANSLARPLPLFHLYGDPPDDQAFDFIHIETIASRSSIHNWTIRAHRHRNLFQILVVEQGQGEMIYEAAQLPFIAPVAIIVPAAATHGFRFARDVTAGWVITFTEDAAFAVADRSGEAMTRLRALGASPIVPISGANDRSRLSRLCQDLFEEGGLAREGHRMAMRCLLALIAVGAARLAASRARTGVSTLHPADTTMARLQTLVNEFFHHEHEVRFYAMTLGMTVDRLNDHIKRATGVTAGRLIRRRLITEAKRQLVFTTQPIQDIAAELSFSDPSHFARFFRKHTGATPHEFRARRG